MGKNLHNYTPITRIYTAYMRVLYINPYEVHSMTVRKLSKSTVVVSLNDRGNSFKTSAQFKIKVRKPCFSLRFYLFPSKGITRFSPSKSWLLKHCHQKQSLEFQFFQVSRLFPVKTENSSSLIVKMTKWQKTLHF